MFTSLNKMLIGEVSCGESVKEKRHFTYTNMDKKLVEAQYSKRMFTSMKFHIFKACVLKCTQV